MSPSLAHPKTRELETISKILDQNPIIYQMSLQDLTKSVGDKGNGANGMTAEQVVRVAIIKQMEGYCYQERAFHSAPPLFSGVPSPIQGLVRFLFHRCLLFVYYHRSIKLGSLCSQLVLRVVPDPENRSVGREGGRGGATTNFEIPKHQISVRTSPLTEIFTKAILDELVRSRETHVLVILSEAKNLKRAQDKLREESHRPFAEFILNNS